ncbi:MAG TPA: glycogen debranching protein GlgX [Myxococcota bacterium]|jgi:glycogen operon protein|nr:glycogen debranching protein GlgX [Myxococcota bacterium]
MDVSTDGVRRGASAPLGASVQPGGVNFSLFSKHATCVELLLFDREDAAQPSRTIALDAARHRTYHYWHVFVPGLEAGQLYGYRVHGPFEPQRGLRFDPQKLLLDPYALEVVVPEAYTRAAASAAGDDTAIAMKGVVADARRYDWEGDRPLQRPRAETVVYELHVRGFTRHPSSGVAPGEAGTYAGLIGKIPYLQALGVTAVELLPVFQFDAQDAPAGRVNYWGYAPVALFAPHRAYSSRRDPLGPMDEFRDLVKAFHRAGIEVILDVVFNHTAEGGEDGPTLSFRGLENAAYYLLENGGSRYSDLTGTGNTLNANHPVVRRLIRDSLHYWVEHMHVDGFRFDLASILARDEAGRPMPNPPILWDIESDPVLAGTKLIAEAWDAAGLYQVGSFIGDSWQEWNGRFRDDVRRFLKGDEGMVGRLANRLLGSPDVYGHEEREPEQSINFVTCHDGFTLEDLVSYDRKHNDDNGEQNRDGSDDNASWNCGVEGPSDDPAVEALRSRQIRNFLVTVVLAAGTPMLSMGDEMRRTQRGNNNAYCQDNEISWLDWSLLERHRDVHRFVKEMLAFRRRRDVIVERPQLTLNELLRLARIEWHGVALRRPDWSQSSHSLAFTITSLHERFRLHGMINAFWEALRFELPPASGGGDAWRRWVDTSLPSPNDLVAWEKAPRLIETTYRVEPRSLALLVMPLAKGG